MYIDYINFHPTLHIWSPSASASFQSFGRLAFALSMAIITWLCISGNSRAVNWWLSLGFWEPMGKLTLGAYLVAGRKSPPYQPRICSRKLMDCVAPLRRGGGRRNPSATSRCGSPLLLLTCALLMTSSHSEAPNHHTFVLLSAGGIVSLCAVQSDGCVHCNGGDIVWGGCSAVFAGRASLCQPAKAIAVGATEQKVLLLT